MARATIQAKAQLLIRRPSPEVFEAFVNPDVTSKFWFTSGSARIEAGRTVEWRWDMYDVSAEVGVREVEPERRILIEWPGQHGPTTVQWSFEARPNGATFVRIENYGFSGEVEAVAEEAIPSTEGFALVLAGAKAWLEHGLDLNLIADHSPDRAG
jgi:uncharacterized protein YndB with AHSA1/START domain